MDLNKKIKRLIRGTKFVSRSFLKTISLFFCFSKIDDNKAKEILNEYSINPCSSAICTRDKEFLNDIKYDLSIIISTYNNASTIKRCIDSILHQNSKYRYEIIIVNDGSNDNTKDVLKAYEDINNITIIHQENQGLSAGRNAGISICKGRYIMFVDGDDFITNDCIDVLLDSAFKYNSDIAFGGFNSFSSGGMNRSYCYNYKEGIIDPTVNLVSGFACGKVYKREMWQDLCFPIGYLFEDSINAIIMVSKAKVVSYVNKPIYNYVSNQSGITHSSRTKPKAIDSYYVVDSLYKDKIKLGLTLSNYDLGYIFRQIKLTYGRIKFLKPKIIKCIFYMWCDFIKKYNLFQYDVNNTYRYSLLGGALINRSYFKFILAMPLI